MTELKDGIKKIILAAEEGCDCQQRPCDVCADGIAQRIADSLVVDEEKMTELVACAWCVKENENKEMDVVLAETIIKAIAEAKPICVK